MDENESSKAIIGAAIEVHRELGGPGLLESVYEEALCQELQIRGISVSRQQSVPIRYKGKLLESTFRLDLLVNDKVIVEVKATTEDHPIFATQLLTYLRISDKRLGLLINFGNKMVKDGVDRVVNQL